MRRAVLFGFCMLASAGQGLAAEATADEARRLVELFHRYVGAPRAGQADHVRAEPQGDAYRLTIDFDVLASPLLPLGVSLEGAEVSFRVEPLPDGTWAVSDLVLPTPVIVRLPDQVITYRWEGSRFEGIFDPALAAFARFDQAIATTSSEAIGAGSVATTRIGEQSFRGNATAAEGGTVNIEVQQTLRDMATRQTLSRPSTDLNAPASPPLELAYSMDSVTVGVTAEGVKTLRALDLWSYAVARAQESRADFDQQKLKALLTDLLPLFTRLDEVVAISGLRAKTPFGAFGMDSVGFRLTLPGILPDSGVALSLELDNPSFPDELAPPWAKGLVPTELAFGFDLSGFNLDAAARHLLETFDANRSPPVADADIETAAQLALPDEGGRLKVFPGRIGGPLLGVEFEGEMTLEAPAPYGTFTVTAAGFDEAISSLNGASGNQMESQVLGFLTLAKMWGRPTGEGATEFLIEMKNDGAVIVNGQTLRPANGASP